MKITLSNPSEIRQTNSCNGRYAIHCDGLFENEAGQNWKANKIVFFWTKKAAENFIADLPFRNVIND